MLSYAMVAEYRSRGDQAVVEVDDQDEQASGGWHGGLR